MKKMLRFVLLLIVAFGIAGGAGVWKVRQLAESQILIKDETIFTRVPGGRRLVSSCMTTKLSIAHAYSSGCCVLNRTCPISRPAPIALPLA